MIVHCKADDMDAVDFAQRSIVDSMNVLSLEDWKEQSRSFERMFHACSWTIEPAQA